MPHAPRLLAPRSNSRLVLTIDAFFALFPKAPALTQSVDLKRHWKEEERLHQNYLLFYLSLLLSPYGSSNMLSLTKKSWVDAIYSFND